MKFFFKDRISKDLVWSFISLIIMALSGILFNILVAIFYNAETLGIVNQVFALYIIFSQVGTLGIQFSVQKHISATVQKGEQKVIFISAFLLSFITSLIITASFFFLSSFFSYIQDSPSLDTAIRYASPGLFFFCINKIILGTFNGFRFMIIFSFMQALRGVTLILTLFVLFKIHIEIKYLTVIFSVTEFIIFLVGSFFIYQKKIMDFKKMSLLWLERHVKFGIKSMFSGVLIELNTRVDVLMLGFFMNDTVVGIYSIAATIAEGFSMILIVFRNNFNPIMAILYSENNISELIKFISKWKYIIYKGMIPLTLVSIMFYWGTINFVNQPSLSDSLNYFIILSSGIAIGSGHFPFLSLLLQAHYPGYFSISILLGVIANIILNCIFIPYLGGIGAAVATAIANIIYVFFSVYLINNVLKQKLL